MCQSAAVPCLENGLRGVMQFLKTEHGIIACERVIAGIVINPVDPPGVCDPIREQLSDVIFRYMVRCCLTSLLRRHS